LECAVRSRSSLCLFDVGLHEFLKQTAASSPRPLLLLRRAKSGRRLPGGAPEYWEQSTHVNTYVLIDRPSSERTPPR